MKINKLWIILFSVAFTQFFVINNSYAGEKFTLKYQKSNRWVAQDDAKQLRSFIKAAKVKKASRFYVQLPSQKREVAIERLMIIRDILENSLKRSIIIAERDSNLADKNSLVFEITN